ncbi:DUF4167 domain-containing protein [Phenylobacterium sp.]|uniref:DUF4167 domain-containing protein n=1 Tax=Phenylobacterium sp. TaxID=1871053 RepID=UPI0039C989A3
MKRQRGRNRGGGGGGKPQQQNANRAFDSNGPEGVKVRGNAQHVFEKYQQLARDAGSAGDRVLAENYLQHAEHYFRLLRAMQPQRSASEILGRDQFTSGIDIDFEDESGAQANAEADAAQEAGEGGEAEGEARGAWQGRDRDGRERDGRDRDRGERSDRDERPRDDRPRDDRQRDRFAGGRDRDRGERNDRDDRPRDERPRDDRPRDDRPREDRPRERFEGQGRRDRDDRGGERRERFDRTERGERPERDPMPVTEPQATPLVAAEERPSPMLRDAEGGESHAPAFLQSSVAPRVETPDTEDGAAPAKRPRRRRAPRTFEAGSEGAAPSTESEEV